MKTKLILLLGLFLLPCVGSAENAIVSTDQLKAYVVFPPSVHRDATAAWVEFRSCRKKTCVAFDRIGVAELGLPGMLEIRSRAADQLEIVNTGKDVPEVLLAQMSVGDGWYAPVELCSTASGSPQCRYQIERQDKAKSYTLRIFKNE